MELQARSARSHSAQGLSTLAISSPSMKIPLPPRLWITDISDESSDDSESIVRGENVLTTERARVRSRFRHHKSRTSVIPIGIFWDIENCQVPRGCSALDVVSAIRAKFLPGRREADFVVVCDVRKELAHRLQELNDAQVSLIHVCGTQKNAADEKLRQCMRRFGELHSAPAALLLISGDINFAADLSDFRYRKNMDVILVHKSNTSSALIACATSHYCYNDLTALLPRNPKTSQTEEEEPTCEMEILNLPSDQPPERVSRRLRRLADNCGGKVLRVTADTAMIKFPTPDHASRALKRMDGEDVFGYKIGTRYARAPPHAYSSDEGYGTATQLPPPPPPPPPPMPRQPNSVQVSQPIEDSTVSSPANSEWSLALQQLPPPPAPFCPPPPQFIPPQVKPRKIRGTHGVTNFDQSASSSTNSGDDSRLSGRAASPWNSSASFSEQSDDLDASNFGSRCEADLTVSNLPPFEAKTLREMLTQLFSQHVQVIRVSVWPACDGPVATVTFRHEWDARMAIARVHKRRLGSEWSGRRLELSLGRPSPAPNLDVLRARLRAVLREAPHCALPLLRLRDAYASRHCCALSTADIAKVRDTVIIHEGFGRMVQLVEPAPPLAPQLEEAPWKCPAHAVASASHEDATRILAPVYIEIATLAQHVMLLLKTHGGILPLLSFVECYSATFPPLGVDAARGVSLELLLRSAPGVVVRDSPSRHLARADRADTPSPLSSYSDSSRSSKERERPRTAPALEPMLSLFERELVDLLRTAPRCSIPFSKLIPAFHHHFGRQCRVADYGFTKLPELLTALHKTIVVLGSGSSRVITISAAAQSRRWTADLLKLLRNQPGRALALGDVPPLYQATFGCAFSPADYGVCTFQELMARVTPHSIIYHQDGSISLPRRTPTPEEKSRTVQFAVQAIELLCYTPNLRMDFSRFVPSFHAHFGKQLRVAHYGCVKLVELFELIPDAVRISAGICGEREVRLALKPARLVIGQRLRALSGVKIENFAIAYAGQFSAPPQADMLDAESLEGLVAAAGGAVVCGQVRAPGEAPAQVSLCLAGVAALSGDRSVRGSAPEYLEAALGGVGRAGDARHVFLAGAVLRVGSRVQVAPAWRAAWRAALLLAEVEPRALLLHELLQQYTNRYEPVFPCAELGFDSLLEFLRYFRELFSEDGAGRFSVRAGVAVPRGPPPPPRDPLDFSIHDTPPGQKGSRVFESPNTNIWCSPPASALPAPSALLSQDKRRTRLAAQFNAA